jgi:hypothetical protein
MDSIPAHEQTKQAKRTHILVPNGDIILKTTGDPPKLFQVHSHILTLLSPAFAKELLHTPLASSKTGDVVISFNQEQTTTKPREVIVDADPVALLLTLQILHHKVRNLPPSSKVSPLLLNEIAKIAERYELQEPLSVWMEKWAGSFFKLDLRTSWEDEYDEIKKWTKAEELARLCSFHWAFGNDREFKIVTGKLVESVAFRNGKPVDDAVSKWVPQEVLGEFKHPNLFLRWHLLIKIRPNLPTPIRQISSPQILPPYRARYSRGSSSPEHLSHRRRSFQNVGQMPVPARKRCP